MPYQRHPDAYTVSNRRIAICQGLLLTRRLRIIKLSPVLTLVWFVTGLLLTIQRAPHCRVSSPTVIALAVTLLLMVYIRFVIQLIPSVYIPYYF